MNTGSITTYKEFSSIQSETIRYSLYQWHDSQCQLRAQSHYRCKPDEFPDPWHRCDICA